MREQASASFASRSSGYTSLLSRTSGNISLLSSRTQASRNSRNTSSTVSYRERGDAVVLKQSLFIMKDPQSSVGHSKEDTYHGTRMDQQALIFHTRLHEWNEAQHLSSLKAGHIRSLSARERKEIPLPVRQYVQIEHWAKNVNKHYNPRTNGVTKPGLFMKIDVSKYNMSPTKTISEVIRNKSASSTKKPPTPVSQGGWTRSASAGGRSNSRKHFGRTNDVNSVHNHLLETQFHYSGQRRDLYSANSSTRKTVMSTKTQDSVSHVGQNGWAKTGSKDSDSEARYTTSLADESEGSSLKTETLSENKSPTTPNNLQPVISSRSWSNQMMNVISIDDCKLNCRYRPQKIKESRGAPIDYEEIDRKRERAKKKDSRFNGSVTDKDSEQGPVNGKGGHIDSKLTENGLNGVADPESVGEEVDSHKVENSSPGDQSYPDFDLEGQRSQYGDKTSEDRDLLQSRETNFSYGRDTRLYGSSKDLKTIPEEEKKKKKANRAVRISTAIDGVVQDRKVLNTMDRNFDVRVAFVGRTVIEETQESKNFRRRHSKLRKHISDMLESKCAVQTNKYHEMRKRSITQESVS